MTNPVAWDPNEWEKWCLQLLRLAYGAHQLQEMPARHGGDLGIEAFTYSGHAFQCYAAEEPASVADRYENQRDKLTRDMKKLMTKSKDFEKLLGATKISCYFFLVPYFDSKELVLHAQQKAAEYRAAGLSFVDAEFRVRVVTDDAFHDARNMLLGRPRELISIPPVTDDGIQEWMAENTEMRGTVDRKLSNLFPSINQRHRYISELISHYVESENYLQKLRERYPDQWEDASRTMARTEKRLNIEYLFSGEPQTAQLITKIVRDLERRLREGLPILDKEAATTLAWGAIGDWLIRCPLDFEESGV
ncbi:hypothetical protein ACLQ3H_30535 [Micromonospora saelicesensis]|uniref:Uncharacterized protein n=1 Tax=Micromonospora noduli TaxID=709876 RepID=A0A328MWT6_9ACTN|nr:hypothetical protein [Micromonospora noduli]RAN96525.1 hypothetical protein LAH08_05268 [Micromonospora noduli]